MLAQPLHPRDSRESLSGPVRTGIQGMKSMNGTVEIISPDEAGVLGISVRRAEARGQSRATYTANGEPHSPLVKITAKEVHVEHSVQEPARVAGTTLIDEEGKKLVFREAGWYPVKPGTYKHLVFGTVWQYPNENPGTIISTLRW